MSTGSEQEDANRQSNYPWPILPNELWLQILSYLASIQPMCEWERKKGYLFRLRSPPNSHYDIEPYMDHLAALHDLWQFSACSHGANAITRPLITKMLKHDHVRKLSTSDRLALMFDIFDGTKIFHLDSQLRLPGELMLCDITGSLRRIVVRHCGRLPCVVLHALNSRDIELHLIESNIASWWACSDLNMNDRGLELVEDLVALYTAPCLRSIDVGASHDPTTWSLIRLLGKSGPPNLRHLSFCWLKRQSHTIFDQAFETDCQMRLTLLLDRIAQINSKTDPIGLQELHIYGSRGRGIVDEKISKAIVRWFLSGINFSQLRSLIIEGRLSSQTFTWLAARDLSNVQDLQLYTDQYTATLSALRIMRSAQCLTKLCLSPMVGTELAQSVISTHGSTLRVLSLPWYGMDFDRQTSIKAELVEAIVQCCPRLQSLTISMTRSLDWQESFQEFETLKLLGRLHMLVQLTLGLDCTPCDVITRSQRQRQSQYRRVLQACVVDKKLVRQIWHTVFGAHETRSLSLNKRVLIVGSICYTGLPFAKDLPDGRLIKEVVKHFGRPWFAAAYPGDPDIVLTQPSWRVGRHNGFTWYSQVDRMSQRQDILPAREQQQKTIQKVVDSLSRLEPRDRRTTVLHHSTLYNDAS